MGVYNQCTICRDGHLNESREVGEVHSNVRHFRNELFRVWRCHSCNSLHSLQEVDLEFYYQHYPLQQHKLDLWARIAYANRLKRFIREGVKPGLRILDFGCGQGLFVKYLVERGYKNSFGYDAFVDDFSDKKVLDYSYDVINAQDVIEHAEDPTYMMRTLSGLIGPGGVLCIGTPNADRISLHDAEKNLLSLHQPYHRHILSENALIQLGRDAGLKMTKIYHRWYYDTFFPTVNHRFLQTYIYKAGNVLDAAFEPPRVGMVISSPKLIFYALFGYFLPPLTEMTVFFRKQQ